MLFRFWSKSELVLKYDSKEDTLLLAQQRKNASQITAMHRKLEKIYA